MPGTMMASGPRSGAAPSILGNVQACGAPPLGKAQSLLDEWKAREAAQVASKAAKEAALADLIQQQAQLRQRIEECSKRDSRWWPELSALQTQLQSVEQSIKLMLVAKEQALQAEQAQNDKYGRLCQAISAYLKNFPSRTCLLSHLAQEFSVQREWTELKLSRIVRKSTEMKEVIAERPLVFELYKDAEGRDSIRFSGETGTTDNIPLDGSFCPGSTSPAMPVFRTKQRVRTATVDTLGPRAPLPPGLVVNGGVWQPRPRALAVRGVMPNPFVAPSLSAPMRPPSPSSASSACPVGSVTNPGPAQAAVAGIAPALLPELSPQQILQVEIELLKAGGAERFRKLCLHCGVQEEQLAGHFRLYEERGKVFVSHLATPVAEFEARLLQLSPARTSIMEAMVLCMQYAAQHGRRLVLSLQRSLELPDLTVDMVIARLFLLSDVLFNSASGAQAAARYRQVLEELLPDICERLGRLWLPKLEPSSADKVRAEDAARAVLAAWRSWDVFPSVFIGGLEALLLSPAPDPTTDISQFAPENETDSHLRQKLQHWLTESEAAQVRIAARHRGLAGPNLPMAQCRLRFCHYERYWHLRDIDPELLSTAAADAAQHKEDVLEVGSIDGDSAHSADMMSYCGEPLDFDDDASLAGLLTMMRDRCGSMDQTGDSAAFFEDAMAVDMAD